jgi:hypothetical protein
VRRSFQTVSRRGILRTSRLSDSRKVAKNSSGIHRYLLTWFLLTAPSGTLTAEKGEEAVCKGGTEKRKDFW